MKKLNELLAMIPVRIKAGMWIALASFISEVCQLVLDNLTSLDVSPIVSLLIGAVLTAVISQVTKYLNSQK